MKEYTLNIEKLINYIKEHFTGIDCTNIKLIRNIAICLKNANCSLAGVYFQGKKIYVENFLYDFFSILNDSDIDLSLQELIETNILEEVEK